MTNVPISETVNGNMTPTPEEVTNDPSWVLCSQEAATGQVLALQPAAFRGKAIVDSGASDNIVGAETLQELAECLEELEFDPQTEIVVDRQIHKRFVFGNGESSAGLGLSHVRRSNHIWLKERRHFCCHPSSSMTWMQPSTSGQAKPCF